MNDHTIDIIRPNSSYLLQWEHHFEVKTVILQAIFVLSLFSTMVLIIMNLVYLTQRVVVLKLPIIIQLEVIIISHTQLIHIITLVSELDNMRMKWFVYLDHKGASPGMIVSINHRNETFKNQLPDVYSPRVPQVMDINIYI